MSEPADLLAALVIYLKADAGLTGFINGEVFGGELPREENVDMPQRCVVLNLAGGGMLGRAYQDYGDRRVDTFCYGRTLHEAEQVHMKVRAALKQLTRAKVVTPSGNVLIHWARLSSDGATGRDPETTWPLSLASYQVLAGDTANA